MLFEARPSCIDSSISSRILLWLQSHSIFASKHTFFPGKLPVIHSGPRGAAAFWPPAKLNSGHLEISAAGRPGRPGTRGRFRHARIIKNKGFPLILQYYCCLKVRIRPIFHTDYLITTCSLFRLCTNRPPSFPSTIRYWSETVRLGPNRVLLFLTRLELRPEKVR